MGKKSVKKTLTFGMALVVALVALAATTQHFFKVLAENVVIGIAQTVDNTTPLTGQNFTYTIKYSTPSNSSNVLNGKIVDVLPANVKFVSYDTTDDIASVDVHNDGTHDVVTFYFKPVLDAGITGIVKVTAKFPEGITPATVEGSPNVAVNQPSIQADNSFLAYSNPVTVTPRVNATQDWSIAKSLYIPSDCLPAVDYPVTYRITLRGPSVQGGLNLKNITVTDTLPTGAVFLSATDGGSCTVENGTVSWTLSSLAVGAAKDVYVTVKYPSVTFPIGGDVINSVVGDATLYDNTAAPQRTAQCTHHFDNPVLTVSNPSKVTRQSNERYSTGQTADYYIGNIRNTGNVPLDRFVITDNIPTQFGLTRFTTGTYSSACTVQVQYQTNLNSQWQNYGAAYNSPNNVSINLSSFTLADGEKVTALRWIVENGTDGLAAGFRNTANIQLTGVVGGLSGTSFTNTVNVDAIQGETTIAKSASKTIYVIDPMGWLNPQITTQSGTVTYNYNDVVTFNLRIGNHSYATGNLTDPVAVDVLPDELENIEIVGWDAGNSSIVGNPTVTQFVTEDGHNAVRWQFTGSLAPGQYVNVQVKAKIKNQTLVGYLTSKMYQTTVSNADSYENDPASLTTDTLDMDGDGVRTDKLALSTNKIFVKFKGSLSSTCLVKGQLDAGYVYKKYPEYSNTYAGGVADYKITISNSGSNGPIKNIVVIDKLPGVNDTGVLDTSARGSQWTPYLVNHITVCDQLGNPITSGFTIYYSTVKNPTCTELSDPLNNTGATADGWSTTIPEDITSVRSIKVVFDSSFVLGVGDAVTIQWPMRAPVGAQTGLTAWNSFGYGATYDDAATDGEGVVAQSFLPSEPFKAGFVIDAPIPANLGDRVFIDANKDGIQQAGEAGINGILVNLYRETINGEGATIWELTSYTRTGNNGLGEAGYYLFPKLDPGSYKVEFVYPKTYTDPDDATYTTVYHVSPMGTGGNNALDSDGNPATITDYTDNGTVKNSIQAVPIVLNGVDNSDVDLGIYELCSLQGTVWYDRDADGTHSAGETQRVNSATVTLYESDGTTRATYHSGVQVPVFTTGADGIYHFENLEPGNYVVKFTPADGYKLSPKTADSEADPSTGFTSSITLGAGDQIINVNEGMHLAKIGDTVWNDANSNGIKEAGDNGVAGVTVGLYLTSNLTTPVATQQTDSSGNYSFDDLMPGDYKIKITLPGTYSKFTLQAQGSDRAVDSDTASDGWTGTVTLAAGDRHSDIDSGIYKLCTITGKAWNDYDMDGVQDGGEPIMKDVAVALTDASGNPVTNGFGAVITSTVTDASGSYSFVNLEIGTYKVAFTNPSQNYKFSPAGQGTATTNSDGAYSDYTGTALDPLGTTVVTAGISLTATGTTTGNIDQGMYAGQIGNLVFDDKNADGVFNGSDAGISGLTVSLLKASDQSVVTTTTTGTGGTYLFPSVLPGDYIVQVSKGTYNKFSPQPNAATPKGTDGDNDVDASGKTVSFSVAVGERFNTIDAGMYKFCTIGDKVWNDLNANGEQDAGEPGIKDIVVKITYNDGSPVTNGNGVAISQTTTSATGIYSFPNLIPGTYKLEFVNPSSVYKLSPSNKSGVGDTVDSDGTYTTDTDASAFISNITLTSGTTNNTYDQGMYLVRIGDKVWDDLDADGVQDAGEPGIANVRVQIKNSSDGSAALDVNGVAVADKLTDASGNYVFENLAAGQYYVQFQMPAGFDKVTSRFVGDSATDSNTELTETSPGSGYYKTDVIASVTGDRNFTIDAGFYKTATIGNYVWHDKNGDGIQNDASAAISGVNITLYNADGTTRANDADGVQVAVVQSAADGSYSFTNLRPGTYVVGFETPAGYSKITFKGKGTAATGSDIDRTTGKSDSFTVISKQVQSDIDAGYFNTTSVNGLAWHDKNGDGVQNDGEILSGVTVALLDKDGNAAVDADGAAVTQKTTQADGSYTFGNLSPASYIVKFTLPGGYTNVSPKDQGGDDTLDCDIARTTLRTDVTPAASGIPVLHMDAGFYKAVSIGNRVWHDLNGDGVQDAGETGISGASVTLQNSDGSTAYYPDGTAVSNATTDASGSYSFTGLKPGSYRILFHLPTGYASASPKGVGSGSTDSDADATTLLTGSVTLASGESTVDLDAGFFKTVSIGDKVWNDLNANGVQDLGELGIQSVWVSLKNSDGSQAHYLNGTAVADKQTDANGAFSFVSLRPGSYKLVFVKPSGYASASTPFQAGDTTKDSNVNVTTLESDTVTLVSNDVRTDIDAGFYKTVSVAGKVWDDLNANGVQNGGEPTVSGVSVVLLDEGGLPARDNDGALVSAQSTITGGAYLFNNLKPGKYIVQITCPDGFKVSPRLVGSDRAADSDIYPATKQTALIEMKSGDAFTGYDAGIYSAAAVTGIAWHDLNGDGIRGDGEPVLEGAVAHLTDTSGNAVSNMDGNPVSAVTTGVGGTYLFSNLTPGDYKVTFTLPDGYTHVSPKGQGSDNTKNSDIDTVTRTTGTLTLLSETTTQNVDAGFYKAVSIGNRVWNDLNGDGVQDGGEAGINGASVTLQNSDGSTAYYPDGTAVQSATTDASGNYIFSGLRPGSYRILFHLPTGYTSASPKGVGGYSTDSDADVTTLLTGSVTLASGESTLELDAGFFKTVSIGDKVWDDLNANGIQDAGEPGIQYVWVALKNADGTAAHDLDGLEVADKQTDSDGSFSFSGLQPGSYQLVFTKPAGYASATAPFQGSDTAKDSNINATTLKSDIFILASGDAWTDYDAGFYKTGSVAGRVWDDLNANGIQDSGEPSVSGVSVALLDESGMAARDNDGSLISAQSTDADGGYLFDNLKPGKYSAEITCPESFKVSPRFAGSNRALDSDIYPDTKRTAQIEVKSGEALTGYDAGVYGSTAVTGVVWYDLNSDGIRTVDEPLIEGAEVHLTDASGNSVSDMGGNPVSAATTGDGGTYLFSNLTPGDYKVTFTLPDGYTYVSPRDQGSDDAKDSDIDTGARTTVTLTLLSEATTQNVDAGFYNATTIGDTVFEDVNANGIQDSGDKPIAGATVILQNSGGSTVMTASTDADGYYLFTNVLPGSYKVHVNLPVGMTNATSRQSGFDTAKDSDIDPVTLTTDLYTAVSGVPITTADAGFYASVSISGIAWHDQNGDGVQNDGEMLFGVTFSLYAGDESSSVQAVHTDGTPVADITTGPAGTYSFTDLKPGSYHVVAALPAGYILSDQAAGSDPAMDSDFDFRTFGSDTVTLASGESAEIDAGAFLPARVEGTVWNDQDKSGTMDAGEELMLGIQVQLYSGSDQVAVSYTGSDGKYSFENLRAGDYTVKVVLPGGRVETYEPDGTLDKQVNVSLTEGEPVLNIDFGVFKLAPATIGNLVWNDVNANGIYDDGEAGVPGIVLTLYENDGNALKTATTDAGGSYLFDNLDAGTYVVKITTMTGYNAVSKQNTTADADGNCDFNSAGVSYPVTVDYEQDQLTIDAGIYKYATINTVVWQDENRNGTQDGSEKGLPGVTVVLLDENGVPLASTITDANGHYRFDNLEPGTYSIKVVNPGGMNYSDSTAAGQTGVIKLSAGDDKSEIIGLYEIPLKTGAITGDDIPALVLLCAAAFAAFALAVSLRKKARNSR